MTKWDFNDYNMFMHLKHKWEYLLDDAEEFEFDYNNFKILAAKTHTFLLPYDFEEVIPAKLTQLLFAIYNFSKCNFYISQECENAKILSQGFLDRILYTWPDCDKNVFTVIFNGIEYNIDTQTFDLPDFTTALKD